MKPNRAMARKEANHVKSEQVKQNGEMGHSTRNARTQNANQMPLSKANQRSHCF
jgi:hypothetical protein